MVAFVFAVATGAVCFVVTAGVVLVCDAAELDWPPVTVRILPHGHLIERPARVASTANRFPHPSQTTRSLETAFGESTRKNSYSTGRLARCRYKVRTNGIEMKSDPYFIPSKTNLQAINDLLSHAKAIQNSACVGCNVDFLQCPFRCFGFRRVGLYGLTQFCG